MAINTLEPATKVTGYTTDSVVSKDGTTVGYRQLGHGPGIVMLHGAMEWSQSHMQLALALADRFTIYLPDRRGRGMSGAYGKHYTIQESVDDVAAILSKTGATNIFGVSSGGLIMLQAALELPAIRKVALYEPALVVNQSVSTDFLPRYDREIAEGKTAAALVTGMLGAQMGPPMLRYFPRWLLERFTASGMKSEDATTRPDDVTMRKLAPTLHYDFQAIVEMADQQERFKSIQADVLLLGGSKSPAFLKTALDTLEKVLPHAERIEFPGLDHGGSSDPGQTNRNGNPALVAEALRRFFA